MDIKFIEKLNNIDEHAHKIRCYLNILQSYTEREMIHSQTIGNINEMITDCLNEINCLYKYI